jgi:hypothetical protein
MDRDTLRQFVVDNIDSMTRPLGISHWKIDVLFDLRCPDGDYVTKAECNRKPSYDRALINLNAGEIEDEEDARKVLLHELFHVVLSPFDLCRNAGESHWRDDPIKSEMMQEIWTFCVEQAVINLERMHRGLTTNTETQPMGRQKAKAETTTPKAAPKGTAKPKAATTPKGGKPAKPAK